MSFWQTLKTALFHPTQLGKYHKLGGFKTFLYFLLITIMLAIPFAPTVYANLSALKNDINKFSRSIPNFKIENNQLTMEKPNDGLIFQGHHAIFTFDPNNHRTKKDIQKDITQDTIVSVDLNKNHVMVALQKNMAQSINQTSPFVLSYKQLQLNGLTKQQIVHFFTNTNLMVQTLVLATLIFLVIFIIPNYALNLLILTISALLYCRIAGFKLNFGDNLKLCIFSATWPTIIQVIAQLINPTSMIGSIAMLLNLGFYFIAMRYFQTQHNQ